MKKSQVTRNHFLKPDQKLPKPVEPRVSHFDNPSPGFVPRDFFQGLLFNSPGNTMGKIPTGQDRQSGRMSQVPLVGKKILFPSAVFRRSHHLAIQHDLNLGHIVSIGSGHDERERDATGVHQKMALAPFFFPDPSDSFRRPPEPEVLWSSIHRWTSIPRQSLPSRRTQPDRASRVPGALRPDPIPENTGEWRWDSKTAPSAEPSIESLFEAHRRFLQKPINGLPASPGLPLVGSV